MSFDQLLKLIQTNPENVEFDKVIKTIEENYQYTPCRFTNGKTPDVVTNEPGTNEGSCKIFSFAQLNDLNVEQTLHCFGKYYREDVLQHPEGNDHANIRNFIKYGWDGIQFEQTALARK